MLPPIPSWDGLHPIIVHFPIALLLVAPILIILGLIFQKQSKTYMISAFALMLIGTVAAFIAVQTGQAAGELAERMGNIEAVLENHEELAETTRNIFAALTVIFGAFVFIPMVFRKDLGRKIVIPIGLAFLLFYGGGTIVLMNAAHEGGRLVHEFGVRAMVANSGQPANQPNQKAGEGDDED
jgi:uncharacterized membrane protein